MNHSLFAALCAGKDLDEPAILCGWDRMISYGALFEASGRLAHRLIALGVGPGDRIAVQVGKSAEALILYLASLRVGAVYLPLNTDYTPAEIGYFLTDAEPGLFIVDPADADAAAPLAAGISARLATLGTDGESGSLLEHIDTLPASFTDMHRAADDLAAILYTSGTTGRSKGAMLTHGNLTSNAATLVDAWRFTADDELLHALPVYHIHGLFVATNVPLLAGARIRLLPKFEPGAVLRGLETATVMMGVPTFYTRLLADPRLDRNATKGMRLFVSGSAPLLAETHRAWEERTGHRILERYGMSETGMNTSNPYEGERRPGTVGPALPGVSIRIVDEQTRTMLPAGEIGMIEVKGPNVFKGYWRMPEKTATELKEDGYFITGDLGRLSLDGYLEIVGRDKDLVITGGLNVYPKEVETEIDTLDGVEETAVIGLPHPDFGEAVTAIVVRSSGSKIGSADILEAISARLARFKLPKTVFFVDALPRNAMGKVQKNILREELLDIVY
ncbi:malonate--CoA ligase [Sphingobium nicotianae]|uniref:Malonyl-CoA synthase n=1 Tax=Sphingobium nicotianae TaxID=2782607 RepID=A0A9X1AJ52_9SPHN|nr:malonyl-CoA synthase [Sphingobium nicotianae]MBT2185409.1 malonyl-CoA synthase [Sphingobium nicotianae]